VQFVISVNLQSCEVGHTAKLTCVKHGMGSILTSSTDGTVRVSTPTQKPEAIAVIMSQAGEVTGVSRCGCFHVLYLYIIQIEQG
jgi:hypothetical protein